MMNDDNILVIVPPRPEYQLEFSYSNLYSSPSACDYPYYSSKDDDDYYHYATHAPALPPVAHVENRDDGVGHNDGGEGGDPAASTTTSFSSSSTMTADVAFDSSNFDAVVNDDDDDDDGACGRGNATSIVARDPRNGAFTFRVHAEYDMLLRVQGDLDGHRGGRARHGCGGGGDDDDDVVEESIRLSRRIMRSIDDYCTHEQWMYHIGREKGEALSRFLRSCLEDWHLGGDEGTTRKFVCVELGTYCGYSALVLAVTMRRFLLDRRRRQRRQDRQRPSSSSSSFEFQIYTTDVSTKLLNVARSIFRLAGMEGCITPILVQQQECADDHENNENDNGVRVDVLDAVVAECDGPDGQNQRGRRGVVESPPSHSSSSSESLSGVLRERHSISKIDFLLLDHAKHLYLSDLRNLERSKLIGKGTHVCADNVVFNRLDAYREHMRRLEQMKISDGSGCGGGVVETRLEEMNLEYSNNLKDGMGKFVV
ncbi:hypothetical protein ACHAW5_009308 [Stephanodiscus triporus]|uniref:Catechol O-methyltransferase n=1 Tax=Stephanodiscus triporus TaxID=2934178 RepID=A0ABD3QJT0_9STRA